MKPPLPGNLYQLAKQLQRADGLRNEEQLLLVVVLN
jgi:hypothetical protein